MITVAIKDLIFGVMFSVLVFLFVEFAFYTILKKHVAWSSAVSGGIVLLMSFVASQVFPLLGFQLGGVGAGVVLQFLAVLQLLSFVLRLFIAAMVRKFSGEPEPIVIHDINAFTEKVTNDVLAELKSRGVSVTTD